MAAFRVLAYNRDSLVGCLISASPVDKAAVLQKLHLQYFTEYFSALNAKTILVENNYIDHDYLEDYAAYYVRCFQSYERNTTRLHFFNCEFDETAFQQTLTSPTAKLTPEQLQAGYLGFVVVKPLPQTIIGRTCLKAYPHDGQRREFPILRSYSACIFGITLTVESLAYQEQDTVVAACATSALWSCFQGTGKLFQHSIPSPVEITKAATDSVPENLPANSARALPNAGLTATQMALAVREVNLEPFIVSTTNRHILNSTLYAYLKCKIPSILVCQLLDVVNPSTKKLLGNHAVTVAGFSLNKDAIPIPYGDSDFLLRSSAIDKLYAHDDQIGPFARMEHAAIEGHLQTSWRGKGIVYAVSDFLLLPLYHKVRIPFEVIHDAVLFIDRLLEIANLAVNPDRIRPVWDIYLTTVGDFKNDVFDTIRHEMHDAVEATLTAAMPKFLWRATAWCGNDRQLELLFDATGIDQQRLLTHVIEVRPELPNLLAGLAPHVADIPNYQARAVFEHFSP